MWLEFYNRFVIRRHFAHSWRFSCSCHFHRSGVILAWSNLPERRHGRSGSQLSIVNMFGVFWEISIHLTGYQKLPAQDSPENSLNDTMLDLIYNNIGASIGILVFWWYLRKSRDVNAFMENGSQAWRVWRPVERVRGELKSYC